MSNLYFLSNYMYEETMMRTSTPNTLILILKSISLILKSICSIVKSAVSGNSCSHDYYLVPSLGLTRMRQDPLIICPKHIFCIKNNKNQNCIINTACVNDEITRLEQLRFCFTLIRKRKKWRVLKRKISKKNQRA